MRLVLLGPPGAGKGTQAQFLTKRLGIPKISTGDMLRDAAERGTATGLKAKTFIDEGHLVPDDLILEMVWERLGQPDAAAGWLLDGFPRTVGQSAALDRWLREQDEKIDGVVDLQVDDDEIVRRISQRRVCPQCHATYHLSMCPPSASEVCDACGNKLETRQDDRAEVVRERLRIYHERTEPVVNYYLAQELLIPIHGDRPVEEVTEAILRGVQKARDQRGPRPPTPGP